MPLVTFADEEVTFDEELVTFGEEGPPEPDETTTATLLVEWDGAELAAIEWNASGQELLGGIDTATFTAQDRNPGSTWEPAPYTSVVIKIRASGWVLFRGESLTPRLSLPNGFPWRRWVIPCRGYWSHVEERLVGAPHGGFLQIGENDDPNKYFLVIDPVARSFSTDEVSIQTWVLEYFFLPTGQAIDTDAFVFEYVPNAILGEPQYAIDETDGMTTLGGIVGQLAALADVNVQDWLCPGGYDDDPVHWHHVAIPEWEELIGEDDPEELEQSPYALWDKVYDPDGISQIGHAGIEVEYDGQAMPEVIYVQGASPAFIHDGVNPDTVGGSGWYPTNPSPLQRQAYLSVPDAWEQTRRDTVAASALRLAEKPALRATVDVIGWNGPTGLEPRDGFRAGMIQYIRDPRLPFTMTQAGRFVIQSISWSLVPGTDVVRYTLGFGDGPPLRASQRRVNELPKDDKKTKAPMTKFVPIDAASLDDVQAGESRELDFVPNSRFDEMVFAPGLPVTFRVVAYDADEVEVPDQGSCDPASTVIGEDGHIRTTFTAGDVDDLDYDVFPESEVVA